MISRETEKAVFDVAVESLDFGSGFLDDEQVDHLRAYAVYLGVDPMEATPFNFRAKFCSGHEWEWSYLNDARGTLRTYQVCRNCRAGQYAESRDA